MREQGQHRMEKLELGPTDLAVLDTGEELSEDRKAEDEEGGEGVL